MIQPQRLFDTEALRRRRYERLSALVGLRPTDRIIEIGCGRGPRSVASMHRTNPIVGVDLLPPSSVEVGASNFTYRQADAADLSQFADGEFDVAISIGLLEHIQPRERLEQVVREHRRVARRYAAVTTHRFAFIEPHYRWPLFSIWPEWLKRLDIGPLRPAGTRLRRDGSTRPINWLASDEWLRLFDDPTARTFRHWYGPLLLFLLIVGGEAPPVSDPAAAPAQSPAPTPSDPRPGARSPSP
jgi:hypothetical protein